MTTTRKAASNVAIWVLLALVATFAFAPLTARGADRLDAPGLTSPGGKTRLDINDVYVFRGLGSLQDGASGHGQSDSHRRHEVRQIFGKAHIT